MKNTTKSATFQLIAGRLVEVDPAELDCPWCDQTLEGPEYCCREAFDADDPRAA